MSLVRPGEQTGVGIDSTIFSMSVIQFWDNSEVIVSVSRQYKWAHIIYCSKVMLSVRGKNHVQH